MHLQGKNGCGRPETFIVSYHVYVWGKLIRFIIGYRLYHWMGCQQAEWFILFAIVEETLAIILFFLAIKEFFVTGEINSRANHRAYSRLLVRYSRFSLWYSRSCFFYLRLLSLYSRLLSLYSRLMILLDEVELITVIVPVITDYAPFITDGHCLFTMTSCLLPFL